MKGLYAMLSHRTFKKRLIAVLIACSLVMSLFITALAQEETETEQESPTQTVEDSGSEDPTPPEATPQEDPDETPQTPGSEDPEPENPASEDPEPGEVPGEEDAQDGEATEEPSGEAPGSDGEGGETPEPGDGNHETPAPDNGGADTETNQEDNQEGAAGEEEDPTLSPSGIRAEDITVALGDEAFTLLDGVEAFDSEGQPIETIEVTDDGGFDVLALGEYAVAYTAADPATEAVYTAQRTVTVEPGLLAMASPFSLAQAADQTELLSEISQAPTDGTPTPIEITTSFDIDDCIVIGGGQNIVLFSDDSAVKTITQTTTGTRHFKVAAGSSLTVQHLVLDGSSVGGGIDNYSTFTLSEGGIITNCSAIGSSARGGGVNNDGTFLMEGGAISGNSINGYGAGVHNTKQFTMTGGIISGNATTSNGGGIYSTTTSDNLLLEGGEITNNTAQSGGGVYAQSNFTLDGTKISNNEAHGANGGGIQYNGPGTFVMESGEISGNKLVMSGSSDAKGGGVSVYSNGTFEMRGGTISNNTATGEGGGVCVGTANSKFIMRDGEISGNASRGSRTGGGVYVLNGAFEMYGGKVNGNTGDGISLYSGSLPGATLTIITGEASGNTGNGISLDTQNSDRPGSAQIQNVTLQNNGGRGLYTVCETIVDYATITGNTGGGIYTSGDIYPTSPSFVLRDGLIQNNGHNNLACGGGITVYCGMAVIEGGNILDNKAKLGGGIGIDHALTSLTVKDATITGNTAENGGGIYIIAKSNNSPTDRIKITSTIISNNIATKDGGGIYAANRAGAAYDTFVEAFEQMTLTGVAFSGNTASRSFDTPKADVAAIHAANVSGATYSSGKTNAYNNLDVGYVPRHNITFDADGGTPVPPVQRVDEGSLATRPTGVAKDQHTLTGWNLQPSNTPWTFESDTVTQDVTLTAQWDISKYTVTFLSNGGTPVAAQTGIPYLGFATEPTVSRDGHELDGWYIQGTDTKWAFTSDPVTGNLTLEARWISTSHTVTFNPNGGVMSDGDKTQLVTDGGYATQPTVSKEGHTLNGWYIQGTDTKWTFTSDPVTGNLTLEARWISTSHTVTFNPNGGVMSDGDKTQLVSDGGYATRPTVSKEGHTLKGWYYGLKKWDFETDPVKGDMQLQALWEPNSYTLTYNAGEGKDTDLPGPESYVYGSEVKITTKKPTLTGYTFGGWSENPDATSAQYKSGDKITIKGHTTLYAVWGLTSYSITYDAAGGDNPPDAQNGLNYQDEVYVAEQGSMTYPGHTFLGWSKNADGSGTLYKYNENKFNFKMPNRSITLYAVWRNDAGYQITVEHYQYNEGDFENATLIAADTQTVTVQHGSSYTASPKSYSGYLYMADLSNAEIQSVTSPGTLKLYYMKADGYHIIFEGLTDSAASLEVLDRRNAAAAPMSWNSFLDLIQPKLYLDGTEVTGSSITYTSSNYNAVNFRQITGADPYNVAVTASWDNGTSSATGSLSLHIVDTTPPEITVTHPSITLSSGEIPPNMAYLAARGGVLVSDNYDQQPQVSFSFVGASFQSIDWSARDTEYVLYIDAVDQSGNAANPRGILVIRTAGSSGSGGSGGSDGGSSGGGSNIRDDHDGGYIVLDDDGVPMGFYVQDDNGNWVFIDDASTPLGTLPRTGDSRIPAPAVLCTALSAAVLLQTAKRRTQ